MQYKPRSGTLVDPPLPSERPIAAEALIPSKAREIMSTSTSLRRRPHCHKCGSPMQGHRRKNGTFVCPEETSIFTETVSSNYKNHSTPLPSPPASPVGSPCASPPPYPYQGFSPAREKFTFKPPPGKRWHWRNPNWVSPPRKMRLYTPSDEEHGSLAPTEPVTEPVASYKETYLSPSVIQEGGEEGNLAASWSKDVDREGNSVQNVEVLEYFPRHSNSLSPRSWSLFSQSPTTDITLDTALRASTPLFKVFRTPLEDLDGVRQVAQHEGKHVAIINAPLAHRAMARLPMDKANGTVWVVVSDRIEDLKYAIDSQQGGMPGMFFPEESYNRGMGFFQVVIAGALGGLMVAVGLACL